VAAASRRLADAGIPQVEADLDARLLAEFVLGWSTERYFADSRSIVPTGFDESFDAFVERRAAHEPYAYIVGREEFWGLQFEVTPDVLIPRPETEFIVEAALQQLPADRAASIADVGTGSGCLAVTIARERPSASIVATDISDAALAVARRNAERHRTIERIRFVHGDLLDGVDGPFDLIASNPPYVPERDRAGLQPEVHREPDAALYAGADGLDVIRRLLPQAAARLRSGGVLLFEFGFGQADAVAGLISSTAGLTMIELRRDLQGIPRIAIARR